MARLSIVSGIAVLALTGAGSLRAQSDSNTEVVPQVIADPAVESDTPIDTRLPPVPDDTLTLPPEIDLGPGAARLEPPAEAREDVLEAVVTGGESNWRLPDLGSSFRREEVPDPNQRIEVNFIPLYDPENEDPTANLFQNIEDLRNVGFLEIFRINFGRRSPD